MQSWPGGHSGLFRRWALSDWKISDKARFIAENSLDIAGGLSTIAFTVGLIAGMPAVVLPAAGVMLGTLGLKLGEGAAKLIGKLIQSKKADRMKISEKLKKTPNLLKENKKT
ncbi:MAG: hypothetical protein J7M18_04240 [Candidatus Eremiobacteraeota bacterium]|nr:hypothetical protein [Candidatus Eremiobacteraeota bacterium]